MAKKKKSAGKKKNTFMKPLQPSAAFAEIVGWKPLPRTAAVKKLWAYIKKHKLQDKKDKTLVLAEKALAKVLPGAKVSMFQMMKHLKKHLKPV